MTDETIFATALEKPTPAERAAYLNSACGGNPELRARIDRLLAAHDKASGFLDRPAVAPSDVTAVLSDDARRALDADVSLSFLEPTTRTDSLGRLGHYEVLEVLGRGGFGIVLRAFDESLHRVVAVKVLSPEMAATSPARKRFLREARASAPIRHENVVQVYAIEETPLPYLVMEFVPGRTLQDYLDGTGPLDAADVVRIGTQVARGLAAAHELGLVHRDIKPANILLEGGVDRRVKITDFGLARAVDDASMTASGVVAGTPLYMAPEQARGEHLDHRADLFSLGSVLYTMCAGHPPFRANGTLAVLKRVCDDTPRPIPEIIPETPRWLCDIIAKLHAKNPDDRFQSAQEVADLLAMYAAEPPALKSEPRAESAVPRSSRLGRTLAAAGALFLFLAVGVFGLYQTARQRPVPAAPAEPPIQPVVQNRKDEVPPPRPAPLSRRPQFRSGGDWHLDGAEFVQSSNNGGSIHFGDASWTDYDVEVECRSVPTGNYNQGGGLVFRAADPGNCRDFGIGTYDGTATECTYLIDGKWGRTAGCFLRIPHEHRRWYKQKVEVRGQQVRCSVDGKEVFVFKDKALPNGMIGLSCFRNEVHWRNLKVTAPDGKVLWEGFPDLGESTPENAPKRFSATTPTEAAKRVGERVTVQYVVESVGGKSNLYLNSKRDFLDKENFSVVLSMRVQLGKWDKAALEALVGKTIRATGLIKLNKDLVQLEIIDENELEIVRDSGTIEPKAPAAAPLSAEQRKALEWVLSRPGGVISMKVGDKYVNLPAFKKESVLPDGPVQVLVVGLQNQGVIKNDDDLKALADLPTVHQSLLLNSDGIGDKGVETLTANPGLRSITTLSLTNARITDKGLALLAAFPELQELNVKATRVTEAGVKALAERLPNCKIEWDGGTIEPKK